MHVLDSTNSVGGLYVAGPPKSLIGRHMLNALVQELLEVLAHAGVTPRASGTADAAAGYKGQVRDALKLIERARLAAPWTGQTSGVDNSGGIGGTPGDIAITSNPQNITPTRSFHRLTGTGFPNGLVGIANDDTNFPFRLLLIENGTGNTLLVNFVTMLPGTARLFYYDAATTGSFKWQPLQAMLSDEIPEGTTNLYWADARFDSRLASKDTDDLDEGSANLYYTDSRVTGRILGDLGSNPDVQASVMGLATDAFNAGFAAKMLKGTFAIEARGAANGELLGTGTARYYVQDGLVTLIVPALSTSTASVDHNAIWLRGPSNTNLPTEIQGPLSLTSAPLNITAGGVGELGKWSVHGSDYIALYRAAAADFASGSHMTADSFVVQYPIS